MAALMLAVARGASGQGMDLQPAPIDRVPAGLDIRDAPPEGWSHTVLTATPRLTSGDVDSVSSLVGKYAQMFCSVVVANVVADDAGRSRLERVGIGIMVPWQGGYRTVDGKSSELGMIGRQVMATGAKLFNRITRIARYQSAVVFDVPALMVEDDKHVERIVRHFVWCSPKTGDVALAVWMIDPTEPANPRLVEETFVWTPAGAVDVRRLHVDSSQFTLGIPGERALAVERLLDANRAKFSPAMAEVAALARFEKQSLIQLATELSKSIQAATPE